MLCENYVNSVKLLASNVEDNTEPSKEMTKARHGLEGVTTIPKGSTPKQVEVHSN